MTRGACHDSGSVSENSLGHKFDSFMASDIKTISLKALERSRSTIEDLVKTYLPLLDLPLSSFFKHMDLIVWLEATIYQLDEENEEWCSMMITKDHAINQPPTGPLQLSGERSLITQMLTQRGLMDERIEAELSAGDSYWQMERDIAQRLANGGVISESNVMQAHGIKSFDYRLLFLVFHRLFQKPYDEALISFLHIDERLVDISDDLADYEDDVEANSFNILRCYVRLYDIKAGEKLVELISGLEIEHSRRMEQLTKDQRGHWLMRHEESRGVNDGGARWQIPCIILDEEQWRLGLSTSESTQAPSRR